MSNKFFKQEILKKNYQTDRSILLRLKVTTMCTNTSFQEHADVCRKCGRFFIQVNSKISKINNIRDLYRGINDFKKGYQPRTIIVKDEKGDLVADSHSIMTRWKNYFSQLLNVHGARDVRQEEIHTAEPLVPLRLSWLLKS